jgi:multiple antibiotic resistance protein
MFEYIQTMLFTYGALFPVLNPLAGAMIFLNLTQGLSKTTLNKLAKQIGINTFILLVVVLLTGSWILSVFGISIPVVQAAGGLVVTSLAWKLLNQPYLNKEEETQPAEYTDKAVKEMAFFPLTMPLTAGPGCIAITLTIGAHEMQHKLMDTVMREIFAAAGILLAAITVWICYRYADRITKKLGDTGSRVIMRLSAFINLCIGLQIAWNGIQGLLAGIL